MNASKENAKKSLDNFLAIIESSPSLFSPFRGEIEHITQFLQLAERKLPREESFQKKRVKK